MAVGVKAIETVFRGNRFRSRIEARWAVFYTEMGIRYEYEREGFDLGEAGLYLPDFWLPDLGFWVEIKGTKMTDAEEAKVSALADAADQRVYVFTGDIPVFDGGYQLDSEQAGEVYVKNGWDNVQLWCECWSCGSLGIEFKGRSDRLPCKQCLTCQALAWGETSPFITEEGCVLHGINGSKGCPRGTGNQDRGHNWDSPRLRAAYTAARSARFEFGEHGRWPSRA